jgi:hypothetical protein
MMDGFGNLLRSRSAPSEEGWCDRRRRLPGRRRDQGLGPEGLGAAGQGRQDARRGLGQRLRRDRSSRRKPAPLRSNWRCVPSPQSTGMRWPLDSTRRPGWLRSADGTLADVPRNVRADIESARRGPRGCAGHPTHYPRSMQRLTIALTLIKAFAERHRGCVRGFHLPPK